MLSIVEDPSWAECVKAFGDIRKIDKALEPILDGLSKHPEGFPLVPGFEAIGIRIAKTDQTENDDGSVTPKLSVWFISRRSQGRVDLLWFYTPPEDENN